MQALVLYESMFGNTHDVATAVAQGLSARLAVTVSGIREAPGTVPADVELLVLGGPTHAFGLSRPSTRRDAAQHAHREPEPDEIGLREWLAGLEPSRRVVLAATFDTRVRRRRVPGSAAHRAASRLRRLGFTVLDEPTTFWVEGTPGPLHEGERERACRWGEQLAARAVAMSRAGDGSGAAGSTTPR